MQPNGLLSGIAATQPWIPKQALKASCNGHSTTTKGAITAHLSADGSFLHAPVLECACGIYARKDPNHIKADLEAGYAIGEVWLWGRIVEHTNGYRAEYAYPKQVWVFGTQESAESVQRLYDVRAERRVPKAPEPIADMNDLALYMKAMDRQRSISYHADVERQRRQSLDQWNDKIRGLAGSFGINSW